MFPSHFKRPKFRKPEPLYIPPNHLCKHSILILKEHRYSSLLLEPEIMNINKEYRCSECQEIFKVMPSKIRMITEPEIMKLK